MTAGATVSAIEQSSESDEDIWRAVASPVRRSLLDLLRTGPRTTGELADELPQLSRFAVMQHLGVLSEAGLVLVRRRGRYRFNHLNLVPLRRWYERWVMPLADTSAAEAVAVQQYVEQAQGDSLMSVATDQFRTVRIETELRFRTTPERLFRALTEDSQAWYPHTYGGDRVKQVVLEPRVGGAHYEDWGGGLGHLYGHVTVYDAPYRFSIRGRITPGTILDSDYVLEQDGDATVLRASKVAVGPMTDEEAGAIEAYGDI